LELRVKAVLEVGRLKAGLRTPMRRPPKGGTPNPGPRPPKGGTPNPGPRPPKGGTPNGLRRQVSRPPVFYNML